MDFSRKQICRNEGNLIFEFLFAVKTGESEVLNTHIVRAGYDTEGEFKWSEICEVTTLALEKELWLVDLLFKFRVGVEFGAEKV